MNEDTIAGALMGLIPYLITIIAALIPKKYRKKATTARKIIRAIDKVAMNMGGAENKEKP